MTPADIRIEFLVKRMQAGLVPIYATNHGMTTTARLALVLDRLKQQCPNAADSKPT